MEFLFGYETKKLRSILLKYLFLVLIIGYFLQWNIAQENVRARASIECSKVQNTCTVRRAVKPEIFKFNVFAVDKAGYHCVSSHRGRCREYDIEFLFKDGIQYARLFGAGVGSHNEEEVSRILNSFNAYLEDNTDYLFLEKSKKFYVSFMDYSTALLLVFLVFVFPFFLLKSQEIYFDRENRRLVIKKYNIFNLICRVKMVNLADVKEFYIMPVGEWYHIKCKPVNIWGLKHRIIQVQDWGVADKMRKMLSEFLNV